MFDDRPISGELDAVRTEHAPSALVLDVERDFETLPPSIAENLLPVVDEVNPLPYDDSWIPDGAPDTLRRLASDEFTVGAPGDGGVAWSRQTDPPIVLVKPRLEGSPGGFVDFLVAEALVEIGLGGPEHFLGFFEDDYRALADATPLSPADTYQLAAALFTAFVGRSTRQVFSGWTPSSRASTPNGSTPANASSRVSPISPGMSPWARRGFSDAAELACSAIKHDVGSDPVRRTRHRCLRPVRGRALRFGGPKRRSRRSRASEIPRYWYACSPVRSSPRMSVWMSWVPRRCRRSRGSPCAASASSRR